MTGTVYHTGQVVIDLPLSIDAVPDPGGDVFADEAGMAVGGGFNVLAASRQVRAPTVFVGTLGRGPFSDAATTALDEIGVAHKGGYADGDLGYCVAMTDAKAERTFVSTRGAETREPLTSFDDLVLTSEDVVYITGYSLVHEANRAAILRLAERLAGSDSQPAVLVDVSPVIGLIPMEALNTLAGLNPIWSVNEREAGILLERLGISADTSMESRAVALAAQLGDVLVRAGAEGSWFARADGSVIRTPSIAVTAIDTNGAGDAHAGVLAGAIARGADLASALRWANVAGALSTTRRGPATCPTLDDIKAQA